MRECIARAKILAEVAKGSIANADNPKALGMF